MITLRESEGLNMKITYAVSPIGLGHASRSVAIANKLRSKGFHIEFYTGGPAVKFLSSYGFKVNEIHERIPFFKVDERGRLKDITRWMIDYVRFYKRTKKKVFKILNRDVTDIIISDEEFAFGVYALENSVKLIFVTDLIQTNFAKNWFGRIIEKRTNKWFREFYERVPLTIVPEENGEKIGNMIYTGPIVRELTKKREEIYEEIGIDEPYILVTTGGSPLGPFLFRSIQRLQKTNSDLHGFPTVFVGIGSSKFSGKKIKAFEFYRDMQNLVAYSELVITTAGKSTIDECLVYGVKCIAIPIKGHYEQERNAKKIGYSYEDLEQLEKLVKEKISQDPPKPKKNNLKKAVDIIMRSIQES